MVILLKLKYFYFFLFGLVLVISSFTNLISSINDKNNALELQRKLRRVERMEIKEEEATLVNAPSNKNDVYWNYTNIPFLEVDFKDLMKENEDTVAWLQVGGTKIDYPVVQTNDNEYYLIHSFDKTKSKAGWIFSDYRNNFQSLNNNTIIYGHKRLDETMFATLQNVLKKSWFNNKDNHIIKISTPTENMVWQIFSVYIIPKESYYITTHFKDVLEYEKFLKVISKRSKYDFNTILNVRDKILTLSTCKDNNGNRLVVHAKLIKKETRE